MKYYYIYLINLLLIIIGILFIYNTIEITINLLIFNADSKEISYYEVFKPINSESEKENPEENSNKQLYLILEIGGAVLLLIIVFVLGYLCHKKIIKIPRKKKANELDDEYEYSINPNEFDEKKASLNNYEVSK